MRVEQVSVIGCLLKGNQMNAHPLYEAALRADVFYSMVIRQVTGKDRWTLTPAEQRIPAIHEGLPSQGRR